MSPMPVPSWLVRVPPGTVVDWITPGFFRRRGMVLRVASTWPNSGCGWCCNNCGTQAHVLLLGTSAVHRVGACILTRVQDHQGRRVTA